MWKEKLDEIRNREAGYGEKLNDPASEEDIRKFREKVESLSIIVPNEYYDFLRVINGVEYNSFIIYGIDEELLDKETLQGTTGFLFQREVWEETASGKYIYLGESSIDFFAYGVETQKYYVLDNGSEDVMEEFNTLDELLERILSHSLL